eukprot:evm.model.scf_489.7 EVM.evm.TU.scf_489.7   scf_489:56879-60955(-)
MRGFPLALLAAVLSPACQQFAGAALEWQSPRPSPANFIAGDQGWSVLKCAQHMVNAILKIRLNNRYGAAELGRIALCTTVSFVLHYIQALWRLQILNRKVPTAGYAVSDLSYSLTQCFPQSAITTGLAPYDGSGWIDNEVSTAEAAIEASQISGAGGDYWAAKAEVQRTVVLGLIMSIMQVLLTRYSSKVSRGENALYRLSGASNVFLFASALLAGEAAVLLGSLRSWFGGHYPALAVGAVVMMGQTLHEFLRAGKLVMILMSKGAVIAGGSSQFVAGLSPLLCNQWGVRAVLSEYMVMSQAHQVSGPSREASRFDPILEVWRIARHLGKLLTQDTPAWLYLAIKDCLETVEGCSKWRVVKMWRALRVMKKRYERRRRIWRHSDAHPSKIRSTSTLPTTTWILESIKGRKPEGTLNDQVSKNAIVAPIGLHVPTWQLSGVNVRSPTWVVTEGYPEDYWGMVMRELSGKQGFISSLREGNRHWAGLNDTGREWELGDGAEVSDDEAELVWKELQLRHDVKSLVERASNLLRFVNPITFVTSPAIHVATKLSGGLCALSMSQDMFNNLMEKMQAMEQDPKYTSEFIWLNALSLISTRLHMRSSVGGGIVREEMLSPSGKKKYLQWVKQVSDRPTTYRTHRAIGIMRDTLSGTPEWKEGSGDEQSNINLEWWGRRALRIEDEGVGDNGILQQLVVEVAIEAVAEALEVAVQNRANTGALIKFDSGPLLALQMKQAYSLLYLNMDLPPATSAIDLTLTLYHVLFLVTHVGEDFEAPNAITERKFFGATKKDEAAVVPDNVFVGEARNWLKVPCPIPVWTESPGEWRPWRLYRSPVDEVAAVQKIPNPGFMSFWQPYKYPGMHCDALLNFRKLAQPPKADDSDTAGDEGNEGRREEDKKKDDSSRTVRDIWKQICKAKDQSDERLTVRVRDTAGSSADRYNVPIDFPITRDTYQTSTHMAYELLSNSVMQRTVAETKEGTVEMVQALVVPSQKELESLDGRNLQPGQEEWRERCLEESLLKLCDVGQGNVALERGNARDSVQKMVEFVESSGVSVFLIAESVVGNFLQLSGSVGWKGRQSGDGKTFEELLHLGTAVRNSHVLRDWARDLSFRTGLDAQQMRAEVARMMPSVTRGMTLENIRTRNGYKSVGECEAGGWKVEGWRYE